MSTDRSNRQVRTSKSPTPRSKAPDLKDLSPDSGQSVKGGAIVRPGDDSGVGDISDRLQKGGAEL